LWIGENTFIVFLTQEYYLMSNTMLKKSPIILAAAMAAVLSVAANVPAQAAEKEKCYGVSKAGKNDCKTANSSCAGTSKIDGQKDAFIALPGGTCVKIFGGSLTSLAK
jgi:uncharacterized membrane protein